MHVSRDAFRNAEQVFLKYDGEDVVLNKSFRVVLVMCLHTIVLYIAICVRIVSSCRFKNASAIIDLLRPPLNIAALASVIDVLDIIMPPLSMIPSSSSPAPKLIARPLLLRFQPTSEVVSQAQSPLNLQPRHVSTFFRHYLYDRRLRDYSKQNRPERASSLLTSPTRAKVIDVYDGDTVTIAAELVVSSGGWQRRTDVYQLPLRLNGIDCAEIKGKTEAEKQRAVLARDALREKVLGKMVDLEEVKLEKYGRLLGTIKLGSEDISQWMLTEGHAVPYDGGTKHEVDWATFGIEGGAAGSTGSLLRRRVVRGAMGMLLLGGAAGVGLGCGWGTDEVLEKVLRLWEACAAKIGGVGGKES